MPDLSIPNLPAAALPLIGNEITVVSQAGVASSVPINQFPVQLTSDELDAVQGANNPDSTNVFATIDDIPPAVDNVVSLTRAQLQTLISTSSISIQTCYQMNDANGGFGVIRVFGLTSNTITDLALNISYNSVGTYDIDTDTYTFNIYYQDLQSVYSTGNSVDGYDLTISGPITQNIGITDGSVLTGQRINAFGLSTATANAGSDINAFGSFAAAQGSSNNVNALGNDAGRLSNVLNLNALGAKAGYNILTATSNINAFGESSAEANEGNDINAFGNHSAESNLGNNVNAMGFFAAAGNQVNNVIAIGRQALLANSGLNSIAFGNLAGAINTGAYCVFIGNNAGYDSTSGTGNTLTNQFVIANTSMPQYNDRTGAINSITVALGAVAGNTYLYYNQTTFAIEGVRL
jgi:hypothetical protein